MYSCAEGKLCCGYAFARFNGYKFYSCSEGKVCYIAVLFLFVIKFRAVLTGKFVVV